MSGFRRGVDEVFALLGCHILLYCLALKYVTEGLSETSANYQQATRNGPERRRPHEHRTLDQQCRKYWAPREHFGRKEDRNLLSVYLFLVPAFLPRYAAN